jgi:hypothetical protein
MNVMHGVYFFGFVLIILLVMSITHPQDSDE